MSDINAAGRGVRIADILRSMVTKGASDIHLQAGATPHMRVDGELVSFEGVPTLTPEQTEQIALAMMSEAQRELFRHRHEVDFAFTIPSVARFRCNVLHQRGSVGVVGGRGADGFPAWVRARRRLGGGERRRGERSRRNLLVWTTHTGLTSV